MRSARKRALATVLATLSFGVTALTAAPSAGAAPPPAGLGFEATADFGSLYTIERIIGAQDLWAAGYTGKGVDVALIDTGVSPVPGLADEGKVISGPDVSFDSGNVELRYLDSYGHGTHMAGIIAGRDPVDAACARCANASPYSNPDRFYGVAPDSRIVSVKAGATDGATDVSQVIAGINWVVAHKDDNGMNIRVLNLSFGTDSLQPYLLDPLAYAVEQAWNAGIVVVVAAGNDGLAVLSMANPASDPDVIAVGGSESNGTVDVRDDTVPAFATHGTLLRSVDVVAPATHVVSLRVPGSLVEIQNPGGAVGERFIRGSGTSQAAAVTSGLAALLVQKFPNATPDQIKAYLKGSARPIGLLSGLRLPLLGNPVNKMWAGNGVVDGRPALAVRNLPAATQLNLPATGLGSLDLARGTGRILFDGLEVRGELDVLGLAWNARTSPSQGIEGYWDGNRWTGNRWTDGGWTGNRWTGNRWTGNRWTGNRWTGNRWTGNRWTAGNWS